MSFELSLRYSRLNKYVLLISSAFTCHWSGCAYKSRGTSRKNNKIWKERSRALIPSTFSVLHCYPYWMNLLMALSNTVGTSEIVFFEISLCTVYCASNSNGMLRPTLSFSGRMTPNEGTGGGHDCKQTQHEETFGEERNKAHCA